MLVLRSCSFLKSKSPNYFVYLSLCPVKSVLFPFYSFLRRRYLSAHFHRVQYLVPMTDDICNAGALPEHLGGIDPFGVVCSQLSKEMVHFLWVADLVRPRIAQVT